VNGLVDRSTDLPPPFLDYCCLLLVEFQVLKAGQLHPHNPFHKPDEFWTLQHNTSRGVHASGGCIAVQHTGKGSLTGCMHVRKGACSWPATCTMVLTLGFLAIVQHIQ
jgi:hypothetical protein